MANSNIDPKVLAEIIAEIEKQQASAETKETVAEVTTRVLRNVADRTEGGLLGITSGTSAVADIAGEAVRDLGGRVVNLGVDVAVAGVKVTAAVAEVAVRTLFGFFK